MVKQDKCPLAQQNVELRIRMLLSPFYFKLTRVKPKKTLAIGKPQQDIINRILLKHQNRSH